jgi:hypothetical protein
MALKYLVYSGLIFYLFLGCKKTPIYGDLEGMPVFVFEGQIGDEAMQFAAGKENYRMHTFYYEDTSGYWVMSGQFGPRDCEGLCPKSLSVAFFDLEAGALSAFERTLHPIIGPQVLPQGLPEAYIDTLELFTFTADNPASDAILWDFRFGDTTSTRQPTRYFSGSGTRAVCLNSERGTCVANICNNIPLRNNRHCRIQFSWSGVGRQVTFFAQAGGPVNWDFGDGTSGSGTSVVHTFPVDSTTYRVCANLVGGDCGTRFCRDVVLEGAPECAAGFEYAIQDSLVSGMRMVAPSGMVVISFMDEDGHLFTNRRPGRNPISDENFVIEEIVNFQPNAAGDPTIKIKASANIWLFNESNPVDSIKLVSNNWVFAIPKP